DPEGSRRSIHAPAVEQSAQARRPRRLRPLGRRVAAARDPRVHPHRTLSPNQERQAGPPPEGRVTIRAARLKVRPTNVRRRRQMYGASLDAPARLDVNPALQLLSTPSSGTLVRSMQRT